MTVTILSIALVWVTFLIDIAATSAKEFDDGLLAV